jgi:hypothetical protein
VIIVVTGVRMTTRRMRTRVVSWKFGRLRHVGDEARMKAGAEDVVVVDCLTV